MISPWLFFVVIERNRGKYLTSFHVYFIITLEGSQGVILRFVITILLFWVNCMEKETKSIPEGLYIDRGTKAKKVYERHDMSCLPIILHKDTVVGRSSTSNWHENVEILLFVEGNGTVYLENVPLTFSPGDICVIDSGELHRVESEPSGRCTYFCLIVDSEFCERQGLAHEDARFVKRIRDQKLAEEYNKVAEAFAEHDEYRVSAVKGAVLSFMVHLLRAHTVAGKPSALRENEGVRTVIRYIRTHYAEPMEVDMLASLAGVSKFHFLREFKRVTGQTVVTYINNLRVERAARMLAEGNTTVAAVAAACGFSSHAYFSKTFYRLRGAHPSDLLVREEK